MISVCMPYWQRQAELDRSLAAYRKHYGYSIEISVCDDGSPVRVDAPDCIVTRLPRKDHGLNPCVPLNAAVRASNGSVVVITNPEIEHREPVLDEMRALLQTEMDYVVAPCFDADGTELAGQGVDYGSNGRLPVPRGAHFHFCAMLHRSLFERVGGFDEGYRFGRACDDNDFLWALHAAGARFRLSTTPVWHYRTSHAYEITAVESNRERFKRKWGHLC